MKITIVHPQIAALAGVGCVYSILDSISGKCYVGSTECMQRRYHEHLYMLRSGSHSNSSLQIAFDKHGESAFELRILQYCPPGKKRMRLAAEQRYLDVLKFVPEVCFNRAFDASNPGSGVRHPGRKVPPAQRAKIAASMRKYHAAARQII